MSQSQLANRNRQHCHHYSREPRNRSAQSVREIFIRQCEHEDDGTDADDGPADAPQQIHLME